MTGFKNVEGVLSKRLKVGFQTQCIRIIVYFQIHNIFPTFDNLSEASKAVANMDTLEW